MKLVKSILAFIAALVIADLLGTAILALTITSLFFNLNIDAQTIVRIELFVIVAGAVTTVFAAILNFLTNSAWLPALILTVAGAGFVLVSSNHLADWHWQAALNDGFIIAMVAVMAASISFSFDTAWRKLRWIRD